MSLRAQLREQELHTLKVTNSKILEWNESLNIFEDTFNWLGRDDETFIKVKPQTLKKSLLRKFGRKSEESNAVEFELDDFTVLNVLQNLGRISYNTESLTLVSHSIPFQFVWPKFIIGNNGVKSGEFCRPWGVCSDPLGRILVSDRSNNRIEIFSESGEFILQFGKQGSCPGEFSRPAGIASDEKCRIIVADKDNHRIQVFTYIGGFLLTFGKQGVKNGEFNYPWDVAVNRHCQIAVSDSKNHRVQLFSDRGQFLAKFGFGSFIGGLRQLDSPRGVAFWPDGNLLVTDFNNHRVIIINKNFTKMTVFGKEGSKPGEFLRPQGIACDNHGRFAVADGKNYRIQIFDHQGNLCNVFGSQGSGLGHFDCPQGISFHSNGNLLVVDFGNNRIQVF